MKLLRCGFLLMLAAGICSQDRVATLPDGSKVIIKPDGTWSPVSAAASKPAPKKDPRLMTDLVPDSPTEILSALKDFKNKELEKDEFETEQQYLTRLKTLMADLRASPGTGRRLDETMFLFRNAVGYDAERQEFDISTFALEFDRISRVTLEFVERKPIFGWRKTYLAMIPPIKMSPVKAQAAKPTIVVAVYGLPVGYSESRYSVTSTIRLYPYRVVVFDSATNEVLLDHAYAR